MAQRPAPIAAAPRSAVADRLAPFGTTIFAEMTRLAIEHQAINLSQGFPDVDGPDWVKDAAARALREEHNQYAPPGGVPALTGAIAEHWRRETGHSLDPLRNITVTAGCTEALASAFLGLVNPGDEVVMFEPFYDSYRACCALAGARPRFVPLRPTDGAGGFAFDPRELTDAFGERTRAILLNTPHNPTGKVFCAGELELIARLCIEHDAIAITDEVYEHLWFEEDAPHVRLATLEGMGERTLTLSSLGKTFSFTGWKIGWAIGAEPLSAALRRAHQFITFSIATPLQHAAAEAICHGGEFVASLREEYRSGRDLLAEALRDLGLEVYLPRGTYFLMADHTPLGFGDDVAFCRHLAREVGVAAIPPSAFYSDPSRGASLVRFAFCKRRETLERAIERLQALRR